MFPMRPGPVLAVAALLATSACSGMSTREQRTLSGGAIGAAGGAAIGAVTGGSAIWGGVLGGAAGAVVGALTTPSRASAAPRRAARPAPARAAPVARADTIDL